MDLGSCCAARGVSAECADICHAPQLQYSALVERPQVVIDSLKISLLCSCLVFCLALFALMQVKAEAEINTDIPILEYFASVRCGVLKSWICRVYDWQQIIHRV